MNNLYLYLSLLCISSSIGFFSCCHSSKMETNENKIVFEIIKIDSWLNLMPGNAAKFHLAGEAYVSSETKINDFNPFFKSIKVSQNKTQIYSFIPVVNLLSEEVNDKGVVVYKIEFHTESGLRINSGMNSEKNIDVELIFYHGFNLQNLLLSNIKLEKAY